MKLLALIRAGLFDLFQSMKRFPVTIFLATATTILLIIIVNEAGSALAETLGCVAMITALGVPLTLCIALVFERLRFTPVMAYGCYALSFGLLLFYYFFLLPDFEMVAMTRYIAVTVALYLAFLSVPYLFKRQGFEMYVIKVLSRFLVTALYSAVLFGGLAITLLTVDLLLGVNMPWNTYTNVFFVVAGIFAPCFFLAELPAAEQVMAAENYPTLLRVLLLYIVMPIILIYTVILYIYFLQTLVTLAWPEGTVSHLVLWYSVFSAGVIFLVYPVVKDSKFAALFTTWFPRLALPAILVMFAAIWIRIQAYGLTENRYFVIALGVWVFGVMLYYTMSKRFINILLPVSLALITLLAVFGPWSAYTLSVYSQNARFEALAASYNMIDGGTLQRPERDISVEDKRKFTSILEYFSRSHNLDNLRLLPTGFRFADMEQTFGFSLEDTWWYPHRYEFFSLSGQAGSMDIRGYDYLLTPALMMRGVISVNGLEVSYQPDNLQLVVSRGDEEIYRSDLRSLGEAIVELYGTETREVPVEDMTLLDENERIGVKLVVTHFYGVKEADTGSLNIDFIEFYLLLRDKDSNAN